MTLLLRTQYTVHSIKYIVLCTLYFILNTQNSFAQNLGVNSTGATPNASSIIDLNTGNTFTSPNGKGLLPPNVALTSITDAVTVTSPASSLLVYNTNASMTGGAVGYYYWNGAKWVVLGGTPQGGIIMWSGLLSNIPAGWALCDGTLGTPNLLDRFILSVNTAENPGAVGGTHLYSLTGSQLPAHSHLVSGATTSDGAFTPSGAISTIADHSHSGTTTTDGAHTHPYGDMVPETPWDGVYSVPATGTNTHRQDYSRVTGSAGSHNHTFTTNPSGTHNHAFTGNAVGAHNHTFSVTSGNTGSGAAIDNRPAYYKLAFIMKL